MKKKRLLVYAALILAFALACTAHMIPKVLVRASGYADATIGTATLADAGDTVFVRMAVFTVGEGDDAEHISAPGFTVANAAAGEDPAEGVDLSVLTPITKENPLTGTLDKDIYVCTDDGWLTDLYFGDLTLTEGHKLYTSAASGLNLLGGSFTADAIVTTQIISIGSADVTVNSDLTGFYYLVLFKSNDALNGAEAKRPASLTVNGSVSNTRSYGGGAIDVNGCAMTVTGDVYTEAAVNITGKSSLTVNGSVTVKKSPGLGFQLNDSEAVIGGAVNADNWVHLTYNSTMKAGSVTAYLLAATQNSSFEIDGDVTLGNFLDVSTSTAATANSIGGDLKCDVFNVVGPAQDTPVSLHVAGDVTAREFYTYCSALDLDGALTKTGAGVFLIKNSQAEVDGDVSGSNFELDYATATVHGNVQTKKIENAQYYWQVGQTPIHGSTLTVDGDADCYQFNPFDHSTVTVKGKLTTNGLFPIDDESTVTCKYMETHGDTGIEGGSTITVTEKLTSGSLINLSEKSKLIIKDGEVTYLNPVSQGELTVTGTLKCNGYFTLNRGGVATVNKLETNNEIQLEDASSLTINSDLTCPRLINSRGGSKLVINGNLTSSNIDAVNGGSIEINGDLNNSGLFGVIKNSSGGASFKVSGNASTYAFTSNPTCSIEIGKDLTYKDNYGLVAGDVTVGGDYVNSTQGTDVSNGMYVTGLLNVGGDYLTPDLVLNYNDFNTNIAVAGDIAANRKADVIKPVEGAYVIEGVAFANTENGAYKYVVPFEAQTVAMTIDGVPYAMDVRDKSVKAYTPVPVTAEYAVAYDTGESEFIPNTVAEERYFPEIGLDLPAETRLAKRTGKLFDGWYDNAGFEGDALTEIPAGTTGDVTLYAKFVDCDHAASTAQPTCTEGAVCTVCDLPLDALGHDCHPTCTEGGPCSRCEYVEPALGHDCGEPTCTEGAPCSRCDYVEPALGHDCGEPTCTEGAPCSRCDYVEPANGHQYGDPELVWADDHRSASFVYTCGACGDKKSEAFTLPDDFEGYKEQMEDMTDLLGKEGDSEACAALISNARTAIDALRYDETLTLDENKAVVDALFDNLVRDLKAQRRADRQEELNKMPCALCGEHHTGSIFDNMIGILHGFIWIMKQVALIVV